MFASMLYCASYTSSFVAWMRLTLPVCAPCSAHSLGFSLCSNKEPAFTLVVPFCWFEIGLTLTNYSVIHPLRAAFSSHSCAVAPARRNAGRASSLRDETAVWGTALQTPSSGRCFNLERYNRPWSVPVGETLWLSYAAECGKKSVITFTWMPPLYQTPWVCHSRASDPPVFRGGGLQGSRTNEAAGISLARYKPLCVKPFSSLEAAPSTSYYFSEWKGFTINDAIMLMELPSCSFASPPTKYQSCWRMGKWKHHCSDPEPYICPWVWGFPEKWQAAQSRWQQLA